MSNEIQLGKDQAYPTVYDPSLLVSIPRADSRCNNFGDSTPNFVGDDIWTAFEVSWLDMLGKPCVRIAEFCFSAASENIVESKSFKYYLNSLNQSRFENEEGVIELMQRDLTKASGGPVSITLISVNDSMVIVPIKGQCVDNLSVEITDYIPNKELLMQEDVYVVDDMLFSHLLKSNCPVTGQPDWATVWIRYSGKRILPESFLRYVVAYRNHQDFHESCVEKIYHDIWQACSPSALTVFARYTRRGGLDINPLRSSYECSVPFGRLLRQ